MRLHNKDLSRSERIHHLNRLKGKRKNYWGLDSQTRTGRHIGMLASTPKPCSCWMCCNARKTDGPTKQEISFYDISE